MTDKQKRVALIGGAAVVLFLLYRWYAGNSAASSQTAATQVPSSDASGSDFASLAGQEQSDFAALQGQEQSDVQTLTSSLSGIGTQEQTDITGVQTQEAGDVQTLAASIAAAAQTAVQGAVTAVAPSIATVTQQLNQVSSGQVKTNRLATETSLLLAHPGWMAAPFGATKPTAPKGYSVAVLGNGYWAFKPNPTKVKGP